MDFAQQMDSIMKDVFTNPSQVDDIKDGPSIENLAIIWKEAKEAELAAIERRRAAEDIIKNLVNLDEQKEGSSTFPAGNLKVKIASRLTRKVDDEKLREIAVEQGLEDHLDTLFRSKLEINLKAWKAADDSITSKLSDAIVITPSRPTFYVTTEGEDE